MILMQNRNRFEDIRRTSVLASALQCLDRKSYLFREAYSIGYPKFTDIAEIRPGQQMTAFVGLDRNGSFLFCWGRQFFDQLLDDTQWPIETNALGRVMFVLAHETLHVVLRHVTRAKGKISIIWNWAADAVVNYYSVWYGLTPLPGSVLAEDFPDEWGIDPATQTTEEIYEILLRNADVVPVFAPGHGHHDQWETLDDTTREILDAKITESQQKAATKDEDEDLNDPDGDGQGCGKLPGDGALGELRQLSDQLVADNRIPWDTMLRHRIGSLYQPCVAERWDRLPTRLASQTGRIVLPSLRMDQKRTGIHLLTALDASASMDEDDINRMRAILMSLPDNYKSTLVSFDTECYIIESLDDVRGGGGTRLDDVNRVAEELEVDCVICLTDGYFGRSGENITRPDDWVFVIDGTDSHVPDGATVFRV